jgi:cell wall assembly regulator SMI1
MAPESINRCFVAVQKVVPDFEGMRKLPPATDEQISSLERIMGLTLPPEFVAWLKLVNGHNHSLCIAPGWNFLSTDEIAMHWGFFTDPAQGIAPSIERTDHPHRMKIPANFAKRIPILADYSGNLLAIDTDPVSPEFNGQIVFVKRDADSDSFVVMPNFETLLDAVSAQVDKGELSLVDGNIVFASNAGMLRPWYVLSRTFRADSGSMSNPGEVEQSASARAGFVAGLTDIQRSACYMGQNELLQTEQFGPEDLDLVRSIVLTTDLVASPDWLEGFPFLHSIRVDGDATPAFFAVLARLAISDLYLQPHTDNGLPGIEALRGNRTLTKLTAMRADQGAFDVFTTCTLVISLAMIGSTINDLSSIANLPKLTTLYINDKGAPDPTPAYEHPTIKEFSLTWRRPLA